MKLSIIIPVYNTPVRYLQECLDSITKAKINYSYEIIIVNDGSKNKEVLDFLASYKEPHTSIIHKENGGLSSARNAALGKRKGKFTLFLDSDDLLLPEINDAIEFLDNNTNYDVVYTDIHVFGNKEYKLKKGRFSKFKLLYIGHITSASNLVRTSIIQNMRFNEDLVYAEDWDFWARVASLGGRFKYYHKVFFKYRKMRDGASLSQKNYNKREEIKSFIKSQFDPHKEITLGEVNLYVLNNFRDNKKHICKLLIILFFPWLFKVLKKKGIYKNDIVVD
ncbi:glycosyltransferase [Riemerella anatipestifer]|nr:glycosyltransferase [Riemerella anatipestifer]MDY3324217.1 glycosyltransferase [Riemerella anatipestifer]MDY3353032.1 glycosyltransferase [Riemerella anatipestifer]